MGATDIAEQRETHPIPPCEGGGTYSAEQKVLPHREDLGGSLNLLMECKAPDGRYLVTRKVHWQAVYRVLVDEGWYDASLGFPYFATGIVFFILNVAIVGYYQSVEQIRRATTFVSLRGLALLVPCFILLPRLLGTEGIWLAMPAAEFTTLAIILATSRRRGCQK